MLMSLLLLIVWLVVVVVAIGWMAYQDPDINLRLKRLSTDYGKGPQLWHLITAKGARMIGLSEAVHQPWEAFKFLMGTTEGT